jgi:hypothetical protein
MGRLLNGAAWPLALGLGLLLAVPEATCAGELDLSVDLRAVSSDATDTRLGGALGKLRYDANHEGLRLGYLRLGYRGDLTSTLRFAAEAVSYGDHDVNPIDVAEMYLDWRPIPESAWRSRVKLGAFYPEISLENRMRGWRSPYTLSFSAINTWVGEELRTIGAEYSLDWLGLAHGHSFEFSGSAAVYGWNDPAGTVIASRGWALHDRQSTLFGRFANPGGPLGSHTLFYDDLDKRAGYYLSSSFRYRGLLELRALHYDNRANLAAASQRINEDAWETYFDSLGARWTPTARITMIGQWLHGHTYVDTYVPHNAWSFQSKFLLASWKQERWRYSVRFDRFDMRQTASNFYQLIGFYLSDDGHAWTVAAQRSLGEHWNAALEAIKVTSDTSMRNFLGAPTAARERQLQLALRYER